MSFPSASEMTSEEQDQELEEYIWSLMGRAGLLSELKSQIAQFVQENGRTKDNSFSVNFSRVNPMILSLIYEYLKWVGMKNTCALLLSESPVPITTKLDQDGPPSPLPQLCTYLSGKIAQADKSSMLNETFTKSELNSVLVTPKAQQQQVTPSNNNNVNGNNVASPQQSPPSNMNQTYVTKSQKDAPPLSTETDSANNSSSGEQSNSIKDEDKSEQDSFSYSKQYERELQDKKSNNKIEEKPLKPSSSDQSLQQKSKDQLQFFGFMTEKQKMEALNKKFSGTELIPKKKVSSNDNNSSDSKSEPLDKAKTEQGLGEQEKETRPEGKVEAFKELKEQENILDISNPLLKKSDFSDPEFDESISDLIDGKTEDQTLDISIRSNDSDSKAMSSCEHIINLK